MQTTVFVVVVVLVVEVFVDGAMDGFPVFGARDGDAVNVRDGDRVGDKEGRREGS